MSRLVLPFLLLFCAALPAAAGEMAEYVSDGDLFRVSLPAGWATSEQITSRRQLLQYGVDAIGPGSELAGYARISVMYYAKGHKQFRTMEKYIAVNSRPRGFTPLKGESFSPVGQARAAGRQASRLEAVRVEYLPPHAAQPRRVRFFQRQLVFPGKTGGFFVVEYYAPLEAAERGIPLFEAVAASLKINI